MESALTLQNTEQISHSLRRDQFVVWFDPEFTGNQSEDLHVEPMKSMLPRCDGCPLHPNSASQHQVSPPSHAENLIVSSSLQAGAAPFKSPRLTKRCSNLCW